MRSKAALVAPRRAARGWAVERMRVTRKAQGNAVLYQRAADYSGHPGGWSYKPQRHRRAAQRH
jgi:hypothetical protein